ncbi:MAG: M18 family aminopeptidase [Lachnospiraceae bacterium]|nr:M18 family aminopeptidase [Lachnospiraceae bacterium]
MDTAAINRELLDYVDRSPVSFFAIRNMADELDRSGAVRLYEGERWELTPGTTYYTTRNDSSLISFRIPAVWSSGFQIIASHCDSPAFRIKTNAEITVENRLVKLNVEKYGGMICESWFDRPLSVAGRVVVQTPEGVETRLICIDRDLLIIPHLAIHMNRNVNDGYKINLQKDMLPLFAEKTAGPEESGTGGGFIGLIAAEAGVAPEDILDTELNLYNRTKGTLFGLNNEFIAAGRLDDLTCAFASLKAFLSAGPGRSIAVHCVYDNEEVGSGSRQGAASTFLSDVLHRINAACGGSEEDYHCRLLKSFMLSADNAHGVHPNHTDKSDPTNRPALNGGIVIKYSANQKYTTDAVSGALFRKICTAANVPVQTFQNRSDQIGGSTLGNISTIQVPLLTADIGLAQLSMHSAYETAGARDMEYLVRASGWFYASSVESRGDGCYSLLLPDSIKE